MAQPDDEGGAREKGRRASDTDPRNLINWPETDLEFRKFIASNSRNQTLGKESGHEIVAGEVGHQQMRKLAVIGDAVNLARRIEQANKQLQTSLLISESAFRQVEAQVDAWQMFEVNLRGKTGLYKLYALPC